ncbi:MAG: sulfotransferase [Actinomycetota bacterium]|nr:sulfotransferase [Actinomycetota bacterium]
MARTTVLYIGGVARSGSTLLDLMLGQMTGHCDVGELFYVWSGGVERNLLCSCGQHFADCPFWTDVGKRAFGGWDQVDPAQFRALQASVDATSRIPMILAAAGLPRFRRRLDSYTATMVALYRAVAEVSGAPVVVDSTKRPSLAFILRRAPDIDLRVVQLVRDPRGVAYSWTKAVALPPGAGPRSNMKTRSPVEISRRWVTVNMLFGTLRRMGVPLVSVRYEDLVRQPLEQLRIIAGLTSDVTDGARDLGFVTPEGVRLGVSHTVIGGRVRMQKGTLPLRMDEEWRAALSPRRRAFISGVTWPLRRRFGYR